MAIHHTIWLKMMKFETFSNENGKNITITTKKNKGLTKYTMYTIHKYKYQ